MASKNPRAFISHGTQDRAFVERFAVDLRANGVDAWYAAWEINAGDSIRAKIDQGLAECEVFIIVLSKASINRPWVQTELDAATVRKLDGKVQKIIPIKIDDCGELPPTLGSLLWEDFSKKPYGVAFRGVLNSIFRVETKPPLGSIPDLPPIVAPRQTKISATTAIFWTAMAVAVVMIASRLTVNIGMPPWIGQLAAGVVLAGIVWKFFERVEAVLTDQTKLETAAWLLGRKKFGPKIRPWPATFAKQFDRLFGRKHLSWKCLWRSCLVSYGVFALAVVIPLALSPNEGHITVGLDSNNASESHVLGWPVRILSAAIVIVFTNVLPDYLSLFETRLVLGIMIGTKKMTHWILLLIIDLVLAIYLGCIGATILSSVQSQFVAFQALHYRTRIDTFIGQCLSSVTDQIGRAIAHPIDTVRDGISNNIVIPTMSAEVSLESTSSGSDPTILSVVAGEVKISYPIILASCAACIWLWLYAWAGFLLKAARRFDIGFDWFNRKFDIEKKPLQSIGLVAGALVAGVYWTGVIAGHFWY